jgi:hypothetical protein
MNYICELKFPVNPMKVIFPSLAVLLMLCVVSSCDVNKIDSVPDVKTSFSKEFLIQIYTSSGESKTLPVEVSSAPNYNDFKNDIVGFEINSITYKIKNNNAPLGMFLNGSVICSNDIETETYTIGSISNADLSALEASNTENAIEPSREYTDKVLSWLDSPGKFLAKSGYSFTQKDGTPFLISIDDRGKNFILAVTFHVTVKRK